MRRRPREIYSRVLEQIPDQPDALYLMGCLAHQGGDSAEAVGLLERAVAARPERPEFHYALGNAYSKTGHHEAGESHLRRAVEVGNRAEFHLSLGILLKLQHRWDEAIVEFDAAVRLDPAEAAALAALRLALAAANRNDEAATQLEHAVALCGGKMRDGFATWRTRCRRQRTSMGRLGSIGARLRTIRDSSEAGSRTAARRWRGRNLRRRLHALRGLSNCGPTGWRLGITWGAPRYEMGQVAQAFEEFKACAARSEKGAELARAMLAVIAPGAPQADNQMVLDVRQRWAADLSAGRLREAPAIQGAGGRLKIGYVSSFFASNHWMKPVWGLINQHDRTEFEVHLLSDNARTEIVNGYRACESDHWFETRRLSNESLAELIQASGIQVLVDLNGFSNMKRLPMYMLRPAPVIVGWFNLYATTGMPCFDVLVGDENVIPAEEEAFYPESILRTRRSYLTFSVDYPVPPVAALPCLRTGQFTFGCLGSQYKIGVEVVEVWSRILTGSPGSRLLIKNRRLGLRSSREFLLGLFERFGVERGRVALEGPEGHFEFLRAYDRVDLVLDTFPYNGGTTTTEAIWQGVPVIAFDGDRWASRTSTSLLRAGGLGEFVARDVEGYIALASHWANSPTEWPRLGALREGMRRQLMASSVCDTSGFAREMEAIYRACWNERVRVR